MKRIPGEPRENESDCYSVTPLPEFLKSTLFRILVRCGCMFNSLCSPARFRCGLSIWQLDRNQFRLDATSRPSGSTFLW